MEDFILKFRRAAHREAKELLDEDFVNDFMFHHKLYGVEIFDRLVEECNKL